MDDIIPRWFPFVPIFLFPFMWLVVNSILAKASGWRALAALYARGPRAGGLASTRWRFCSGSMGKPPLMVNMRHILHVETSSAGLGLSMMWLFKAFSKDLLIPWSQVVGAEKITYLFFFTMTRIHLRGSEAVINVSGKPGAALLTLVNQAVQGGKAPR